MEHIRRFQQQLGTERQSLSLLEHQGERLGRRVHGSGYSLPKALPSSPNSKTKDVHIKKALASSIHALRQQVRDLTNKRKNNIGSGATNSGVVKVLNSETSKESVTGNEKAFPRVPPVNNILVGSSQVTSKTVSQGRVPCDISGKPQGKEDSVVVQGKSSPVKRKLVLIDGEAAKVVNTDAKVVKTEVSDIKFVKTEVSAESHAIQERGETKVPSGPSKPNADDTEVGEKLDEMKALCPHDLLGRCNDTACQYQHLPSARPSLQATTKGSLQGTEPPVAPTTKQGWVRKGGGASGGKTGAKVKMVPGGGGKGGCSVAGRTVPERLTADLTKTVSPESHIQTAVQEQLTETTTLGPNKQMTSTAPMAKTHTTQQQTPTTHHHTATPNTTDTEQTERHEPHTETDSRKSSEASTTEVTETERIGTESQTEVNHDEMPTIDPQQTEMPETQTEASAIEPALQNEGATGGTMSSEPQTQTTIIEVQDEAVVTEMQTEKPTQVGTQTSIREPQIAADNLETQTLLDGLEFNLKTGREDRLSGLINTKIEDDLSTSASESLSSSSPGCQPLRRRSKKTGSRPTRCRTLSKGGAGKHLQETTSGQEGQDTEGSVTHHQEEARVTRKSLRVQAKVSPKSTPSQDSSAMPSPRKGRKRKSAGEETTAKSLSSKRRYPARP